MTLPCNKKKCEDCETLIPRGYLRCMPCFDALCAKRRAEAHPASVIYTSNQYVEPS